MFATIYSNLWCFNGGYIRYTGTDFLVTLIGEESGEHFSTLAEAKAFASGLLL